ncbi:hypothetical protein [Mesorhizobium sp. PL10]
MAGRQGGSGGPMAACDVEAKNANAANSHPEFCSNVKANGGSK